MNQNIVGFANKIIIAKCLGLTKNLRTAEVNINPW
jgi:hypothetical protein